MSCFVKSFFFLIKKKKKWQEEVETVVFRRLLKQWQQTQAILLLFSSFCSGLSIIDSSTGAGEMYDQGVSEKLKLRKLQDTVMHTTSDFKSAAV